MAEISNGKTSLICDICKENGKQNESICVCYQCKKFLCSGCQDRHKSEKITKSHDLRDIYKAVVKTETVLRKCKDHDKDISHYCRDHKTVLCLTCKKTIHTESSCEKVYDIEKATEKFFSKSYKKVNHTTRRLKECLDKFKYFKRPIHAFQTAISAAKQSQLGEIKTKRKQIDELLNKLETDATDTFERDANELKEQIQICERSESSIKSCLKELGVIMKSGLREDQFIAFNTAGNELKCHQKRIYTISKRINRFNLPKEAERISIMLDKIISRLHKQYGIESDSK